MNAQPVRRQKVPRYPTRLEVQANPTLLEKHLPPAWKTHAEMAGLVSVLLTANACVDLAQNSGTNPTVKHAIVAPIFVHGEGRGAVGCVVVNPPVFLSEQDAMQVIREELKKAGVVLSDNKVPLHGISIPQHREVWTAYDRKVVPTSTSKLLTASGVDSQKRVAVEYLTAENYFDLGGERSASTVQSYDFPEIAGKVNEQVKAKGENLYFETFYDPLVHPSKNPYSDPKTAKQLDTVYDKIGKTTDPKVQEQLQKEANDVYDRLLAPDRERSKELLRLQVKDFVDWLKGQGVI